MKKITFILALVLTAGLLFGCAGPAREPVVAATTMPVWYFTSRICEGTDLKVERLVTESVSCLHDYSLQVSQMRTIESAEMVLLSGAGLEHFMAEALEKAKVTVDSSQGIELLPMSHDPSGQEADPHIWLSPRNGMIMARNICAALIKQFPENTDKFESNLGALLSDLDELQLYGEEQLQNLSCRELITFHDGFSYFARAFDLTILKSVEEEAGSEASAADITDLINLVKEKNLAAIFTETNGSMAAAQVISAETGVGIYTLDMAMAGDDYLAAIRSDIDTIREALG